MERYERDDKKVLYYETKSGKTLIVQPIDSPICGQCAMAMIAGVTAREIIDQLYSEDGTNSRQRDSLLRKYMDDVRTNHNIDNRKAIDLSGKGIVCIQFGRRRTGHALAFEDGVIYDPAGRVYDSLAEMKADYKSRRKQIRVHAVTYAKPRAYESELMAANTTL